MEESDIVRLNFLQEKFRSLQPRPTAEQELEFANLVKAYFPIRNHLFALDYADLIASTTFFMIATFFSPEIIRLANPFVAFICLNLLAKLSMMVEGTILNYELFPTATPSALRELDNSTSFFSTFQNSTTEGVLLQFRHIQADGATSIKKKQWAVHHMRPIANFLLHNSLYLVLSFFEMNPETFSQRMLYFTMLLCISKHTVRTLNYSDADCIPLFKCIRPTYDSAQLPNESRSDNAR